MTGYIIAQLSDVIKELVNDLGKEAGENKAYSLQLLIFK